MNIGKAAQASGVSAKMIRYYEAIGLIRLAERRSSGYRHYEPADVHRLQLIRMARDVGLSPTDIRELLALWDDRKRSRGEIKTMALAKIAELQRRLRDAEAMIDTLQQLARTGIRHGQAHPSMEAAGMPSKASRASRKQKMQPRVRRRPLITGRRDT